MSDFTFVKVIFSRKTLVTLLICIFENYQVLSVWRGGWSQEVLSQVRAQLYHDKLNWFVRTQSEPHPFLS